MSIGTSASYSSTAWLANALSDPGARRMIEQSARASARRVKYGEPAEVLNEAVLVLLERQRPIEGSAREVAAYLGAVCATAAVRRLARQHGARAWCKCIGYYETPTDFAHDDATAPHLRSDESAERWLHDALRTVQALDPEFMAQLSLALAAGLDWNVRPEGDAAAMHAVLGGGADVALLLYSGVLSRMEARAVVGMVLLGIDSKGMAEHFPNLRRRHINSSTWRGYLMTGLRLLGTTVVKSLGCASAS